MIEDTRYLAVFLIKISNLATGDTMSEDRRQHGMGTFKWYGSSRDPIVNTIKLSCSNLPNIAKLYQQKSP
mgnify:CR=1 FL=1